MDQQQTPPTLNAPPSTTTTPTPTVTTPVPTATTPTPVATTTITTAEPPQQQLPLPSQPVPQGTQLQSQPQLQPQLQSQTPQIQQQPTPPQPSSTPSTSSTPSLNPSPNPIPKPLPSPRPPPQQPPQPKPSPPTPQPRPSIATTTATTAAGPAALSRPWLQHSQFSHFSSSSPSVSLSPSSTLSPQPRGSIVLGVPSTHSSPSPSTPPASQSSSFTGSFGHSFGGASSSNVSQGRPPMQGMGTVVGSSIGLNSQMRPSGIPAHHQPRPVQSSLRPPSSLNSQSPATQNFQGHGLMRAPAVGTSGSSSPSTPQTTQPLNQPWPSSGSQGKPPLPPPSFRPQINPPSLQQRAHIPQQLHSLPTVSQQQHVSSPQVAQPIPSHQQQEHFGQQISQSRVPQSITHQLQVSRAHSSANQKPSSLAMVQTSTVQPVNQNKAAIIESDESGGRILSKRSIRDLVDQIDPTERLDPEVEDILVDIAEDFVDSITTFGCSLAKHRKSDTLEAKDILLHLERNWNMTLPGFSGDEIKTYKKPLTNEIHKERLAAIKKSILVSEGANAKHFIGQGAVNTKGNMGKAAANILGSPNVKIREVT